MLETNTAPSDQVFPCCPPSFPCTERNPDRVRALLEMSAASYPIMYGSLGLLLIAGVVLGFIGNWWNRAWIWIALVLLIAITGAMTALGSRIYGGARKAIGLPFFDKGRTHPPIEPASAEELDTLLAQGNPNLLTAIGLGGIAVIAWLMLFKPF